MPCNPVQPSEAHINGEVLNKAQEVQAEKVRGLIIVFDIQLLNLSIEPQFCLLLWCMAPLFTLAILLKDLVSIFYSKTCLCKSHKVEQFTNS